MMQSSANQAIKDEIARARFERRKFLDLAKQRRSDARECRRRRDYLGAIKADERAREYTNSAARSAEYAAQMKLRLGA